MFQPFCLQMSIRNQSATVEVTEAYKLNQGTIPKKEVFPAPKSQMDFRGS